MYINFSLSFLILISFKSIVVECDSNTQISDGSKKKGICRQKNCENLCLSPKIDAVLNYRNGTIYAFKGNFFYEIMNTSRAQDNSNTRAISNYWSPFKSGIFLGPFDAVFMDNNGFVYFFQNNTIHTFEGFVFVQSITVEAFDRVDSALMVNQSNSSFAYIFADNYYYWKIFPVHTKYDWNDVFSTFMRRQIKSGSFPTHFDVIFEDNHNKIKMITDMKYKTIVAERFPNSLEEEDLIESFIYKDLLNCDQHFYKRTQFLNYDQFIITLLTNEKPRVKCHKRELLVKTNENMKSTEQVPTKEGKNWFTIWLWIFGIVGVLVLFCILIYLSKWLIKMCKKWSNQDLNITQTKRTYNTGINLIRQNDLVCEEI